MKWSEIPGPARSYILYHTIVSPLLIVWYMVPLYMFMTGYSILDVGIIYTSVHIISVPVTYIIGRIFDRLPFRHGLVLIDALDGTSTVLYALAYGPIAPLVLFTGLLIDEVSGLFYPLYQAVERVIYPEDRMKEIFAWHMRLPEASELVGFLILGYIFGHILNTPYYYRLGFILLGSISIPTIIYISKRLPKLDTSDRITNERFKFKVDREFRVILLVEALLTLAWSLAPGIVLLNYIVNVLGLTLFEAMIVEASVSIAAIIATYITDRIGREHRFKAIATGYFLVALWALIMYMNPGLILVVAAYFIARLGDVIAFPFYRSWIFSKIPREKASSILSALSSYRRIITLASPLIAGLLASIKPTLPYLASLAIFTATSFLLLKAPKLITKDKSPGSTMVIQS